MTDLIIIGIVIVLVLVGVVSSKKHFKGEGGCCGGGSSVKPKKKKLKAVIVKKIFIIEGMTCDHCKNRVESVINEIDGVAAKVDIKKKEAVRREGTGALIQENNERWKDPFMKIRIKERRYLESYLWFG